jgi:hypothetical protein
MRTHFGYESSQTSKDRLFSIDFHDFILKSHFLNEVEMAQEYGVSIREVESLKSKIRR